MYEYFSLLLTKAAVGIEDEAAPNPPGFELDTTPFVDVRRMSSAREIDSTLLTDDITEPWRLTIATFAATAYKYDAVIS